MEFNISSTLNLIDTTSTLKVIEKVLLLQEKKVQGDSRAKEILQNFIDVANGLLNEAALNEVEPPVVSRLTYTVEDVMVGMSLSSRSKTGYNFYEKRMCRAFAKKHHIDEDTAFWSWLNQYGSSKGNLFKEAFELLKNK